MVCDIQNRLGIPSISANYATLYINEKYMGFYVLLDAIKVSWVDFVYNDPNTTTLYQCKSVNNQLTIESSSEGCVNENEDVTDHTEWMNLLTSLDQANSAKDIEDIFDVDLFLTLVAYEYLAGSWDHFLNFGHNFGLYKPKNDTWKLILNDFDGEFGQNLEMAAKGLGIDIKDKKVNINFPTYSLKEWSKPIHLLNILVFQDPTRFETILKKMVKEVFNPATLFLHIDEWKSFIRPYVTLDKTPQENGKYPGRLNEATDDYSLAQWEANCEFTAVDSTKSGYGYGLKYWILEKYRNVCETYQVDCDPMYMDENYEYPIDHEVESEIFVADQQQSQ